jgi:hypothetical protein
LDKLSRKKVWGVWMWIGNIPKHVRLRTSGKGGPILLGFLPEVSLLQEYITQFCVEIF